MDIYNNLKEIDARITEAAEKAGKKREDICLLAATKQNSTENVKTAIGTGFLNAAGENRVDEMLGKLSENAYEGIPLHFIGHLQRNKMSKVVGQVELIHSLDSVKGAEEMDKCAKKLGIIQNVLVEVNIGGELSKNGVNPDELDEFLKKIGEFSNISVKGLMTIPAISEDKNHTILQFRKMYELFIDISVKKYDNIDMEILSMGMSDDYYEAILCGSNMVRVGSAIFGQRVY